MEVNSLSTGLFHPRYLLKLEVLETFTHPTLTWLHDASLERGRALFSGWRVVHARIHFTLWRKGYEKRIYNVNH